jgi:hypothetical protein
VFVVFFLLKFWGIQMKLKMTKSAKTRRSIYDTAGEMLRSREWTEDYASKHFYVATASANGGGTDDALATWARLRRKMTPELNLGIARHLQTT